MTMQKIVNTHLEVDFRMVNFEVVFYTNSDFTDLKLEKYLLSFPHPLAEYNASFELLLKGILNMYIE
jgi:hypothetical protein